MFAKYDLCNLKRNFVRNGNAIRDGALLLTQDEKDEPEDFVDFTITIGIEPSEKLAKKYCTDEERG